LAQHHFNDHEALAAVLHDLFANPEANGFPASDACVSPILGSRGAIEFLAHVCGASATPGAATLAARPLLNLMRIRRENCDCLPLAMPTSPLISGVVRPPDRTAALL